MRTKGQKLAGTDRLEKCEQGAGQDQCIVCCGFVLVLAVKRWLENSGLRTSNGVPNSSPPAPACTFGMHRELSKY